MAIVDRFSNPPDSTSFPCSSTVYFFFASVLMSWTAEMALQTSASPKLSTKLRLFFFLGQSKSKRARVTSASFSEREREREREKKNKPSPWPAAICVRPGC